MARIFRKIRQGLLNENENRFIRYMVYVIGEIVIDFDTVLNNKDFMQLITIERSMAENYAYRLENAMAVYKRILGLIETDLNNES
jgi:hypothetical protein